MALESGVKVVAKLHLWAKQSLRGVEYLAYLAYQIINHKNIFGNLCDTLRDPYIYQLAITSPPDAQKFIEVSAHYSIAMPKVFTCSDCKSNYQTGRGLRKNFKPTQATDTKKTSETHRFKLLQRQIISWTFRTTTALRGLKNFWNF